MEILPIFFTALPMRKIVFKTMINDFYNESVFLYF